MRLQVSSALLVAAGTAALAAPSNRTCKLTPNDASWPSVLEWNALNASIGGTLFQTAPVASSCYAGNPFGSTTNCTDVTGHWSYAAYHASWPESVDYSIFTNHSCLPPGVEGDEQISTAMHWANERDIRVVIKGTGHDMSGRSTGAYALSIWTHNFKHFEHDPYWAVPGTNTTIDAAILGAGNNWGSAYTAVHKVNRTVIGGEDATVGLGGLIQNGGHGLLSSTHGLASDSLYQVTIITPDGRRLVANDVQNKDIFWAVRGAGGGQFGVVTEFVLATHPVPETVVTGGLTFSPVAAGYSFSANASLSALVETARLIPDIMDAGLAGTIMAMTDTDPSDGVTGIINLTGFNITIAAMNATITELSSRLLAASGGHGLTITLQTPSSNSYWASTKPDFLASQTCGSSSMISSRLLGRRELVDIAPAKLRHYLMQILTPATEGAGSMALFGLQGGPGTAATPEIRQGSAHPAWRSAYAHFMTYGAPVNATADPETALKTGAEWYEEHIEPVWREWTGPDGGSYANEGNVFSSTFKEDFYGPVENYERLERIKREVDPKGTLFVWGGVGSENWEYGLRDGLLCRV
ncbi:hypothetical protein BDW74DRAFT_169818 [Aspergillus multicolor]|uniref:putative isoamyl alcohol oxidase n=1 Tax=Aspergillus multicolor TaxID=41759 RepID=UPI003CCE12EC